MTGVRCAHRHRHTPPKLRSLDGASMALGEASKDRSRTVCGLRASHPSYSTSGWGTARRGRGQIGAGWGRWGGGRGTTQSSS